MEELNCIDCGVVFYRYNDPERERCFDCHEDRFPNKFASVGVSWNCSGGTRGFGGGGRIPKTPGMNPGHREPTLGSLGLSPEQGASIGIK